MTADELHVPMSVDGVRIIEGVQSEILRLIDGAFEKAMALPDVRTPGGAHAVALSVHSQLIAVTLARLIERLRDVYPAGDAHALWIAGVTDIQIRARLMCSELGLDEPTRSSIQ